MNVRMIALGVSAVLLVGGSVGGVSALAGAGRSPVVPHPDSAKVAADSLGFDPAAVADTAAAAVAEQNAEAYDVAGAVEHQREQHLSEVI